MQVSKINGLILTSLGARMLNDVAIRSDSDRLTFSRSGKYVRVSFKGGSVSFVTSGSSNAFLTFPEVYQGLLITVQVQPLSILLSDPNFAEPIDVSTFPTTSVRARPDA